MILLGGFVSVIAPALLGTQQPGGGSRTPYPPDSLPSNVEAESQMCQSMTSENLDELGRLMAVSWHNGMTAAFSYP